MQWSFGTSEKSTLSVGWGKPCEWSPLEECTVDFSVFRDGWVTVRSRDKDLGTWQLPPPVNDIYSVTFAQEPHRVLLRHGGEGKNPFGCRRDRGVGPVI